MKKIIFSLFILILVAAGVWLWSKPKSENEDLLIFTNTYELAKEYAALSYKTDQVTARARSYKSYEAWNQDMGAVIQEWLELENKAITLEGQATLWSEDKKISFHLVKEAQAYDREEISHVFDQAPAGKKIATLAKHLGVDAKKAYQILKQDQDQVTADAWNEAGDTFQKLETSATVIKDGAKVTIFVGTIVATGGAAGFATGSTIAQAGVVVSGADLILEVSDDAAKIALGNHNKISAIASTGRKVTEPLSGILAVAGLPNNITKGIDKLSAVNFGAEQLNSAVQEGKIIGIELPAVKKEQKFQNIKKYKSPIYISKISPEEVETWINEQTGENMIENENTVKEIIGLSENMSETDNPEIQSPEKNSEDNDAINNENTANTEIKEENKTETESTDISENTNDVLLLQAKEETIGNDWQAALRITLFTNSPIKIVDGKFDIRYNTPFSSGPFSGNGEIHLKGSYDNNSQIIKGSHYRKYEGNYNGEPRTIIYSGNFNQKITTETGEIKIQFPGEVETTRLDGKGKTYSTKDQATASIIYLIK